MLRRSKQSGRLSTTSHRTSNSEKSLRELIDELPPERASYAFTHASWADDRADSYERHEFLGDSVLELALAHYLFERFPDYEEGQMAKIRSHVVSRASCAVVARELGLHDKLVEAAADSLGDELRRLATNRNVLAAVLEAALAALYLEQGFESIAAAIVDAFQPRIQYALTNQVDHKTELQEQLARRGRSVGYALLNAEGPPHARTFTSAAVIDGEEAGVGRGSSKKAAEQGAAKEALDRLGPPSEGVRAAS